MNKIVLSSDHAGFKLKEQVKKYLVGLNLEVVDLGTNTDTKPSSYALQGLTLGKHVANANGTELGIGFCGTGIGISIAVNRVKGARGARIFTVEDAHLAKQHNNANVILLGGRQMTLRRAKLLIDEFLKTPFEGGRHIERTQQLDQ